MKNLVIIAILIAVAVAVIGYTRKSQDSGLEMSPSPTPSVSSASPLKPVTQKPKTGTATSTKTYTELVKQYEGYRVQFDINCQSIPNNTTFKTGTAIMFDNRSGDSRTIKIGDTSYVFPGYGYRILTLTSPTLPKKLLLSCGTAVNVGQILLQQ